ncbi:MAG: hypothetical protein H8E40_03555 [Chloroflexi bacterium]|nr:hypothetical protein [Chloroflexota bacterium]
MRFYPALDDVKILTMPVRRFFALVQQIPKLQAEEDLRALMVAHNPYSKQPQQLVNMLKRQVQITKYSPVTTKLAKQRLKSMAGVKGFEFVKIVQKEDSEDG